MNKLVLNLVIICFFAVNPNLAKCESILNLYQFSGQITSATGGAGTISAGDNFYGNMYYIYDSNILVDEGGGYANIDWIGGYQIHIGNYSVQNRYVGGFPNAKNVYGDTDSIRFYDGLDSPFLPNDYGPVDDLSISFIGTGVIDTTVYPYNLPKYFYPTAGELYLGCYGKGDSAADIHGYIDSITAWNSVYGYGDDQTNPVPEPSTMILFGAGMLGILVSRKRRKN
jgi:hypothetical protein